MHDRRRRLSFSGSSFLRFMGTLVKCREVVKALSDIPCFYSCFPHRFKINEGVLENVDTFSVNTSHTFIQNAVFWSIQPKRDPKNRTKFLFRVLSNGAFSFVLCHPRSSEIVILLQGGFESMLGLDDAIAALRKTKDVNEGC